MSMTQLRQMIRNSPGASLNQHLFADERQGKERGKGKKRVYKIGGRIVSKYYPTQSEEKNFITQALLEYCQRNCLTLFEEYTFTEERGWRFDWCILALQVAFEYEGLMSEKSRHTTVTGYSKDTEKYNTAARLGWTVYRYTALNYQTITDQLKVLCG